MIGNSSIDLSLNLHQKGLYTLGPLTGFDKGVYCLELIPHQQSINLCLHHRSRNRPYDHSSLVMVQILVGPLLHLQRH